MSSEKQYDSVISKEPNKKISTGEFLEELKRTGDIRLFREENLPTFVDITFKEYLDNLINNRKLKRSAIIKASGLTEAYAYQIFAGLRNPSRDKLVALAIGMTLDFDECQRLLRLAGVNELYAKNRRDAVIIYGIGKGLDVPKLNDLLYELNEFTL